MANKNNKDDDGMNKGGDFKISSRKWVAWMVIIAVIMTLMMFRERPETRIRPLTYNEFITKVENNQIAAGTVIFNPQSPELKEITGRFYKVDETGKVVMENGKPVEVPFQMYLKAQRAKEKIDSTVPQGAEKAKNGQIQGSIRASGLGNSFGKVFTILALLASSSFSVLGGDPSSQISNSHPNILLAVIPVLALGIFGSWFKKGKKDAVAAVSKDAVAAVSNKEATSKKAANKEAASQDNSRDGRGASPQELANIVDRFEASIAEKVDKGENATLAKVEVVSVIVDYLTKGSVESGDKELIKLAEDISKLSIIDREKLSGLLPFLAGIQAGDADAKAEKKLRVAITALESLGINRKNCAISASDKRIRDTLEKIRSTMSRPWTASEFIEIYNKGAAEYNAKHSDKIETIFPALVNPLRLIELIENGIHIRVIERLENGNLHVVIPLGTGVDENTGKACIVAISSNIKGQEATRDISLEKLNFTGKGIIILVQAKDSKSIKEEENLPKEYYYSLTGDTGLLGNFVVSTPAENNDGDILPHK